jgi:hypothetical protein
MNLEDTLRRLHLQINMIKGKLPDVFDGISCEDLPMEVLAMYLDSPNGLGYDPNKGTLYKFLAGVLNNKLKDHLRRQRRTVGSLDDQDFVTHIKSPPNVQLVQPSQSWRIELAELNDRLFLAANGDSIFIELIDAAQDEVIDGIHNINQRIAAKMNTTPKAIANLKKRFARKWGR